MYRKGILGTIYNCLHKSKFIWIYSLFATTPHHLFSSLSWRIYLFHHYYLFLNHLLLQKHNFKAIAIKVQHRRWRDKHFINSPSNTHLIPAPPIVSDPTSDLDFPIALRVLVTLAPYILFPNTLLRLHWLAVFYMSFHVRFI